MLSRGFSKDDIEQAIILKSFDTLRASGINILSGTEVTAVDRAGQSLQLSSAGQAEDMHYDTLILAQGSAAFIPPPYQPFSGLFFCLNSLADLKSMRQFRQKQCAQQHVPRWAIIGGGLIGCEIASDLAVAGDTVTIFHAQHRLMERQLVNEDSARLQAVLQASGVKVLLQQQVLHLARLTGKCSDYGCTTAFDGVVVACGLSAHGFSCASCLTVASGLKSMLLTH